jgi:drug/metabolite transporter (DMT)-like permease
MRPDVQELSMNERTLGILFALATALFWGLYGVVLGKARSPEWSPFKPYVFIGVAYLVWGVIAGLVAMWALRDSFSFTGKYVPAMKWGFIAGSLGAFGALTLTYAMFRAKNAGLVMPIVFGGAVTVTAIANLLLIRMSGSGHGPTNPLLWVGMLLVASGIVLVAKYTPHIAPGKPPAGGGHAHVAPPAPVAVPANRPVDAS